jgi:hypothetical protein
MASETELFDPGPKRVHQYVDGDFVVQEDVAVFKEHENAAGSGKPVKFSKSDIQRYVRNSNARIAATGDYATLAIGHTDEEGTKGPAIGFAGPFYTKLIGGKLWAFAKKFRFFPEMAKRAQQFPRVSAELWPGSGTFDPICLLGATTPHLDLGLRFSKEGPVHCGEPLKFSANFSPSQGQESMSATLTDEDIDRIGAALDQRIDAKVAAAVAEATPDPDDSDDTQIEGAAVRTQANAPAGADGQGSAAAAPGMATAGAGPQKFAKEYSELKLSFAKETQARQAAESKLAEAQAELEVIRKDQHIAFCRQALSKAKSDGFVLDVDEQLKFIDELGMNEAQAKKYVESVPIKFSRVPLGLRFPPAKSPELVDTDEEAAAVELSNAVLRFHKTELDKGRNLSFKQAEAELLAQRDVPKK